MTDSPKRASGRLLAGLLLALAACAPPVEPPAPGVATGGPAGICTAEPVFEAPPLNACAGPRVRLAVVGDVLLHRQLQALGYRIGFGNIWAQPAQYLRAADIAVANLEGPVAPGVTVSGARVAHPGAVFDGAVHTGFPRFNYDPSVLRDLKVAGVDLVTTANNHALDRGALGIDLTLAEAARAGLAAVGTVPRDGPRQFVHRRSSAAGTLSFIACTFSTNGIPDRYGQVLHCYREKAKLLSLVRQEAADPAVAGVIVLPHWGVEYSTSPAARERALARELAAAGATAVVGTHPHAVQPFEVVPGAAGSSALVAYSTGNFVASMGFDPSRYEAMALLDICRGVGGRAVVNRAGWIAMEMSLTSRGYWVDIAPRGAEGEAGRAEAFLRRVAPGFSAQPAACTGPAGRAGGLSGSS